jgi:hypothetical protein
MVVAPTTGRGSTAVQQFNPLDYGAAVAALLKNAKLNELGPGSPESGLHAPLAALTPEAVAAPCGLGDRHMARACLAGLWLRHDFLDESHRISQDLENPAGSFWHAIMHRREPDFSNAKYWFRQVGDHPVFASLHDAARGLARQAKGDKAADFLIEQSAWDPFRFVDLCQMARDPSSPVHALCRKIQQVEWELLFDDCYRRAIVD